MFLDEANLPVFFGANPDDLGDYRPGMRAAREASVRSPYIELDINKETIRGLCAYYGLEIFDVTTVSRIYQFPGGRIVFDLRI
jgi:PP-loop superfamily ATP-utilizing enzyme